MAAIPGNVFLPASVTGLPKNSVASVTAVVTLDKDDVTEPAGALPAFLLSEVDRGLRGVLGI